MIKSRAIRQLTFRSIWKYWYIFYFQFKADYGLLWWCDYLSAYSSSREFQIRNRRDQTLLAKLPTEIWDGWIWPHNPFLQSGAIRPSTLVAEMPSDRETEVWSFWWALRRIGLPDKAPCASRKVLLATAIQDFFLSSRKFNLFITLFKP